jgi:hypothetical protein
MKGEGVVPVTKGVMAGGEGLMMLKVLVLVDCSMVQSRS